MLSTTKLPVTLARESARILRRDLARLEAAAARVTPPELPSVLPSHLNELRAWRARQSSQYVAAVRGRR